MNMLLISRTKMFPATGSMQIFDFHLHSKYSRACSKQLDLEHIEHWCEIKGIDIVGTSDFTHPAWHKEIAAKLEPAGNGLYRLRPSEASKRVRAESGFAVARDGQKPAPVFFLSTELSCIYSQGGSVRRVHILLSFPELEHVHKLIKSLGKRGAKLASDGRPILGMSAKDIAAMALDISEKALIVPAHSWTPWFAIFGSKSGFDSVEECFGEYSKYIYALETGLSSDPAMNWRLSQNDRYVFVSNSDAHSLENLGREANVLNLDEVSYDGIYETLKNHDVGRFAYTIEFFPEEGKYHLDGHAPCGFSCEPEETKRLNGLCPKCGKRLTVGVYHRVSTLADRKLGEKPANGIPFKSIVPLQEIIADALGAKKGTKKVQTMYKQIINNVGHEFFTLLEAPIEQIQKAGGVFIAEGIRRMREGKITVKPGYDGIYGTVSVFTDKERNSGIATQDRLF